MMAVLNKNRNGGSKVKDFYLTVLCVKHRHVLNYASQSLEACVGELRTSGHFKSAERQKNLPDNLQTTEKKVSETHRSLEQPLLRATRQ